MRREIIFSGTYTIKGALGTIYIPLNHNLGVAVLHRSEEALLKFGADLDGFRHRPYNCISPSF